MRWRRSAVQATAHDDGGREEYAAGRSSAFSVVNAESHGQTPTDGILSALLSFMFDPRMTPRWKEGFAAGLVEEIARRGPAVGPYVAVQARLILERLERLESPPEGPRRAIGQIGERT